MRLFSLFLFTSISAACFAQSTAPAATGAPSFVQKCSNQFNGTTGRTELVCTSDTSAPIAALKTQSNAMASGTGNMLGTGATTGEYTADLSTCDAEGNCTSAGTGTFSLDSIIGQGDSTGQSDVSEGVEAEITMHNTLDFTCGSTRTHFLGSGIAVKISNCALDASKNVQSFEVSICRKMLQEGGCMRAELNSDSDSSNDVPPEGLDDWSTPVIFTKTTMAFVNNYTRTIDPDATATGSCYSASSRCALDFTVNVNISGDLTELADQAAGTSGNDDLYMSGHNFAQRQADKPSWDAQFMEPGTGDFNAKSMMDCAENSLIGSADQGFLLSCDGTQQVNIASTTCNEVATCVQTETTVISYMTACESFVPISSQTCHVQMPYGSCEVFLESHEQTCDTLTPHGTCVYELESVIQTCDIHIPNGHCNEELVMDDMACVYSVPEGSCNVELISSVETCTNTIPEGTCNVELDTFTKTCQEDVSRLEECLITTETTESDCFAKPRFTIHECESVKDVQEYHCEDKWVLTTSQGTGECTWKNGIPITTSDGCESDWQGSDCQLFYQDFQGEWLRIMDEMDVGPSSDPYCSRTSMHSIATCSTEPGMVRIAIVEDNEDDCDPDERARGGRTDVRRVFDLQAGVDDSTSFYDSLPDNTFEIVQTCEDNICTIRIDGSLLESYDMSENFGVSSNYTVTRVNECESEGFE